VKEVVVDDSDFAAVKIFVSLRVEHFFDFEYL